MKATWKLFVPWTGAFLFLMVLACLLFFKPMLFLGDGGTCRHLTIGAYVFSHHEIPATNFVQALLPHYYWLSPELLADLGLAFVYWLWSYNGLVLVSALGVALSLTWSYQLGRARGLGLASGLLLAVVVMAASSLHWSARAHLFSYLPLLALYYFLSMSQASLRWRLLAIAIVMAVWANLHGSFLIGLAIIFMKVAGDFIEAGYGNDGKLSSLKENGILFVTAALASCLSTRGPGAYGYVLGYIANSQITARTDEWRAFDFSLGIASWAFLALFWVCVALWLLSEKKPRLWEFLAMSVLFVGGLHSMRLVPYFAFLVMPVLGPAWLAFREAVLKANASGWLASFTQQFLSFEDRAESAEAQSDKLNILLLVLACVASACFLLVPSFKISSFDRNRLPVGAVDYMIAHHVDGFGFNCDNWGRYLYMRLGRQVFIDDNTEFYPLSFVDEYMAVMNAQSGWQNDLDKRGIQWVLMTQGSMLGKALTQSPGWQLVYEDNACQLFLRKSSH